MAGWGTGAWGTSAWASGGPGLLYVVTAVAQSDRSVLVELSKAPLQASTIGAGDALNPTTWTVTRLDTGASLLVLSVVPRSLDTHFEIFTLEKFAGYPITMRVGSTTLVDGNGLLISDPKSFDFPGIAASVDGDSRRTIDIENPPFDLESHAGGTMVVDSSGDYVHHSGEAFLKKLLIRRLSTAPGGFFHLPDYGLGIRLKEPLATSDLTKLRAEIERQILLEPEFDAVEVGLSLSSDGILTIRVRALPSSTQKEVRVEIPVPTTLVSL